MMKRLNAIWMLLFICFAVFSGSSNIAVADDAEPPTRHIGISLAGGSLYLSFNYKNAFTKQIEEKLSSGLPTRVILQVNLEKKGKSKPVSYFVQTSTIVYDLWEEIYVVTMEDDHGRRQAKVNTKKEAIELVTTVTNLRIAAVDLSSIETYRVHTLIEVNPVSKEMVENIRKWLARPMPGKGGVEQQTNFFGSFVGIFVDRRIGQADKSVSFVSQWFEVSKQ